MDDDEIDHEYSYCICGKLIKKNEIQCGRQSCIENYESISESINNFFDILENKRDRIQAFKLFESLNPGIQVGILVELDDPKIFFEFLQMLGSENVLLLFEIPSDALRLKFLSFLEPHVVYEIEKELDGLKHDKNALIDYFLNLIDITLLSFQKRL